jgi:hypothetical protein
MDWHSLECLFFSLTQYAYFVPAEIRVRRDFSVIKFYARVQFVYIIHFHFMWVEKGNDPETAEAIMEGSGTASIWRGNPLRVSPFHV